MILFAILNYALALIFSYCKHKSIVGKLMSTANNTNVSSALLFEVGAILAPVI
jgi:hypothetical protein